MDEIIFDEATREWEHIRTVKEADVYGKVHRFVEVIARGKGKESLQRYQSKRGGHHGDQIIRRSSVSSEAVHERD